jgi:N-acetylglucosamine malate deacetylase 2
MDRFQQLLGTSLVLVAHPDDEVIGFGALMQKMKRAVVVYGTDGAPRDDYFWKSYGSREAYAEVRRQEAREALGIVGAEPVFLSDKVPGGIADQELFKRLPAAVHAFEPIVDEINPDCLLTLAYEGGHPDHDSACFIASYVGKCRNIPVWESPLYYRGPDGSGVVQGFPKLSGSEIELQVEGEAFEKKVKMFHTYQSQRLVLDRFRPEVELFRPVADYDFTQRPLPWKLNYELWEWPMTGEEVAAAFASYLSSASERPKSAQREAEPQIG